MPWLSNDPHPLEVRRRQLAERERILAQQMERLREELAQSGEPPPEQLKPIEPPIWRMEDDAHHAADPMPVRKRNLARQRQRDMMFFFLFIGVLLVVVFIVLWVLHSSTSTNSG